MMEEKRGASRLGPAPAGAGCGAEPSLPQPPRPERECCPDRTLGYPLGPLGRQATVRAEDEEEERLVLSVLSGPAAQEEQRVAKLASQKEQPEVPRA